jgi:hypothetical protein
MPSVITRMDTRKIIVINSYMKEIYIYMIYNITNKIFIFHDNNELALYFNSFFSYIL